MAYRIGAACYLLWGLLHLAAAYDVFLLASGLEDGIVRGRVNQDAWGLVFFSAVAIGVAATLNWKNSRTGYWINLATVSAADIGFLLFILAPGHVGLWPSILGPVLWVLGVVFTTIGIRQQA